MQIKKKYKLCEEDFIHFGYYAIRTPLIAEIAAILIISFAGSYIAAPKETFLLTACGATLIASGIMIPMFYFSSRVKMKKHFATYEFAQEEIETTVDKRGFTQKSSLGKTTVPFNKLYKVCESKYGFYVYVSSRQAIILSKRSFDSEEIANIKTLFRENVEKKKLKFRD